MRHKVIGFMIRYRGRNRLCVHLDCNPRPRYCNRRQRSLYKHLTFNLIRGCFTGKYSLYDIF